MNTKNLSEDEAFALMGAAQDLVRGLFADFPIVKCSTTERDIEVNKESATFTVTMKLEKGEGEWQR